MTLGLGSYAFRWSIGHKGLDPEQPMPPEVLLDIAHKHELAVVQYADNMPLHLLSDGALDDLKARADQLGIRLEVGTQTFDAAQVETYIGIARRLNAGILRVALDGPDAAKPIELLAKKFRLLMPLARDAEVRIAIENHFNYPAPRMITLLNAIDDLQLGICLDVANSICAGEWPSETVSTLASHAINLHLKDYVIKPDPYGVGFVIHGCPLGQGLTDCESVLAALPHDPDRSVILEHWLPRSDNMDDARSAEHEWLAQSVDYARNTLGL